jgi:hypothetical protein
MTCWLIVYTSGMDTQPVPLPPEISRLIAANGGVPPMVEDPATQQVYWLVEADAVDITVDEEYIRQEVAKGLADVEAGRVGLWDIESFLAEAHRRFDEQQAG